MPIDLQMVHPLNKAPIVLAIDTFDLNTALTWVQATEKYVSVFKLGLEFFLQHGLSGVRAVQESTDCDLFLDLKLHDIPHTVGAASKVVGQLSPKYLTVHASGGVEMIRAASGALPGVAITAVTVLTSLSDADLKRLGFRADALATAVSLAQLAISSGARAIVCSPLEIGAIRDAIGSEPVIITPGVRLDGSAGNDDQVRTMSPVDAIKAGADLVVIGRPITSLWSLGVSAMADKAQEIASLLI